MLEADPADIVLDDGTFSVRGVSGTGVGWRELAAWAHEHDGGLGSDTDFTQDGATFPFGAHVSIVEVDTDTGLVTPLATWPSTTAVGCSTRSWSPGSSTEAPCRASRKRCGSSFVYDEAGTPADLDLRRLRHADDRRHHQPRGLQHRDADPAQPAGRQGHRRVRHDRVDPSRAERRRRRAEPPRGPARRPALHPRAGVAGDPGRRVGHGPGTVAGAAGCLRATPPWRRRDHPGHGRDLSGPAPAETQATRPGSRPRPTAGTVPGRSLD
ncbi:molybdopterin cofactor-binding domain-containing protein [Nocardioides ungokensis]|uniref:molybdopterin cofactor-binding domain-containing protein n=1 Tax=Nocardioides ungokensis TaxID=1643322 RepID=UPI003CCDC426